MNSLTPKISGELVAKLAKHVFILQNGIFSLAKTILNGLKSKTISLEGFSQHELHPQVSDSAAVDWIFVVDTLNFSFWSPDDSSCKWEVSHNGRKYTGYFALCAAINRAIQEGVQITDPNYYCNVSVEQLTHILRSDTAMPAPMIKERVSNLHEVGKILVNKYKGSFVNCLEQADNSAQKLLELIITDFPCYRDEADYQGHKVALYKRAQILIGDIWASFRGKGLGFFTDIDSITMFADYRIPQSLIHFGALKYSDELMAILKSGVELPSGSPEEVEIRACCIHAVSLVCEEVRRLLREEGIQNLSINSILIDHFLWDYRRQHAEQLETIPFHKTRCIYY
uniref:Queuosine 5'-phosphate N-glycosylase/hydrolase n=1 Tax=Timema poppense TaxID=170557 RepID=A0A7R9GZ93_TIMPO|nr:unnamed protein product [Timema poppensis]